MELADQLEIGNKCRFVRREQGPAKSMTRSSGAKGVRKGAAGRATVDAVFTAFQAWSELWTQRGDGHSR